MSCGVAVYFGAKISRVPRIGTTGCLESSVRISVFYEDLSLSARIYGISTMHRMSGEGGDLGQEKVCRCILEG